MPSDDPLPMREIQARIRALLGRAASDHGVMIVTAEATWSVGGTLVAVQFSMKG